MCNIVEKLFQLICACWNVNSTASWKHVLLEMQFLPSLAAFSKTVLCSKHKVNSHVWLPLHSRNAQIPSALGINEWVRKKGNKVSALQ